MLKASERHFALCFGQVQHELLDDAYLYDFGFCVTLHSLEPGKLKSTAGSSRRRRIQPPNDAELVFFDFDKDTSVLRNLSGRVKDEVEDFFKHPSGTASLHFNTRVSAVELPELCERFLVLYNAEDYHESFPDIRNIAPVKDPEVITILDEMLLG